MNVSIIFEQGPPVFEFDFTWPFKNLVISNYMWLLYKDTIHFLLMYRLFSQH